CSFDFPTVCLATPCHTLLYNYAMLAAQIHLTTAEDACCHSVGIAQADRALALQAEGSTGVGSRTTPSVVWDSPASRSGGVDRPGILDDGGAPSLRVGWATVSRETRSSLCTLNWLRCAESKRPICRSRKDTRRRLVW